jgi:DNA primase
MDHAKDAIRTRGFTMLVEGQMDVLLAHQAGFENAVALSGTALSEKHLALMKRSSENLMLVLDSDRAGIIASARSVQLVLHADFSVKITVLPDELDPADLINKDKKLFAVCITEAKPAIDFFLISLRKIAKGRQLTRMIQETVFPLIESIPNPIEKDRAIQRTALELGSSVEAVRESLRRLPASPELQRGEPKYSEAASNITNVQRIAPSPVRLPTEIRSEQLLAVLKVYPGTPLAERVKARYCQITEAEQLPLDALPEQVLFKAEQTFGEKPKEDAADELLRAFEEAVIREAYQEAVAHLRRAEAQGDISVIKDAQAVCARISARLAAFKQ